MTMGSVSSLITSNSLNSKHCKASEFRLKKEANHHQKSGGCSLDGLLKCGFTQVSSSPSKAQKGLSHSRSGRSEDFFYIKVDHKSRSIHHRGGLAGHGGTNRDGESDRLKPKLRLLSGNCNEMTTAEKSLVHSTAFKTVIPKSTSSIETDHNILDHILEKSKSPDIRQKHYTFSGNLSDSGRNSLSSLRTHSNSGSLSTSIGPHSQSEGSSAPPHCRNKALQPVVPPWAGGNGASSDRSSWARGLVLKGNGDAGSSASADEQSPLSDSLGGVRSPITTDESLIEHLEQRLLERDTELQDLQGNCEEKEANTYHVFECCDDDMDRLKQQCSNRLKQVSQVAAKTQQTLKLQVSQLQAEKEKLQEDVLRLTREKDLVMLKLRSSEAESIQLAPALEETQWEVCQKTGEISLLKKQLKDCQVDVSHKLNEIVSLRASLKEITAKMEMLQIQNKDHGEKLQSRTIEVEVCQNELQRKKNEADLLREKVVKLEKDIQDIQLDVGMANEQKIQHCFRSKDHDHAHASERMSQGTLCPARSQGEERIGQSSSESLQTEVETLKHQLRVEKEAQEKLASSFEKERQTWNKEKDRVIKYQKQLQINYLQMHKKNQDLERILREVTTELETQAELGKSINYNSGLQTYDDVIATEI